MLVLTVPQNTTSTVQLSYTPQFLLLVGNAVASTAANVTVLGVGNTVNLTSNNAIRVSSNAEQFVGLVNIGYAIPLADGVLRDKKCNITISTAAASGSVLVYAMSFKDGSIPVFTQEQTVIALTQQKYSDFLRLFVIGGTSSDVLNIMHRDGSYNNVTGQEMSFLSGMYSNYPNTVASGDMGVNYMVNNINNEWKSFDIQPSTNRTVVLQKLAL